VPPSPPLSRLRLPFSFLVLVRPVRRAPPPAFGQPRSFACPYCKPPSLALSFLLLLSLLHINERHALHPAPVYAAVPLPRNHAVASLLHRRNRVGTPRRRRRDVRARQDRGRPPAAAPPGRQCRRGDCCSRPVPRPPRVCPKAKPARYFFTQARSKLISYEAAVGACGHPSDYCAFLRFASAPAVYDIAERVVQLAELLFGGGSIVISSSSRRRPARRRSPPLFHLGLLSCGTISSLVVQRYPLVLPTLSHSPPPPSSSSRSSLVPRAARVLQGPPPAAAAAAARRPPGVRPRPRGPYT